MIGLHQKYIEQNIDLIENGDWNTIFSHAPNGLGQVLWEAGIDFMSSLESVPARAFCESSMTSMNIPRGVVTIEHIAFERSTKLLEVNIPNSVTTIGADAFAHCESLEHVCIPNSIDSLSERSFAYCHNLRHVILSQKLTTIKKGTFFDCQMLERISIPASITKIEPDAFGYCGHIDITFDGTKAEWKNVNTSHRAFIGTTYTCTCIDGVVRKRTS